MESAFAHLMRLRNSAEVVDTSQWFSNIREQVIWKAKRVHN
jgi:hypothetical protein